MKEEIKFKKYIDRGADYHYRMINKRNLRSFRPFTYAVYMLNISLFKIYYAELVKNETKEIKILDIGCGDGVLLYLLNKNIPNNSRMKLHGVDLSGEAISVAKSKMPNSNFKVCDVYNIDFEDNYFDIIISSDVIEHVQYPEKMLKEVNRLLKDNGKVIISTPVKLTETPIDKMHVQEFFQTEFIKLCSQWIDFDKHYQSHSIEDNAIYQKQHRFLGLSLGLNRYLYNIQTILFDTNRFMKFIKDNNQIRTYQ